MHHKKIIKSLENCRSQMRSIQLIIDRHEENQKLTQTWTGYFDLKFSPKTYFEEKKSNAFNLCFLFYKKILLQPHELNAYLEEKHQLTDKKSNLFIELNISDLSIESKSYKKYVKNRKITKKEEAGTVALARVIQLLGGENNYKQLPICDLEKLYYSFFPALDAQPFEELIKLNFPTRDILDRLHKGLETPMLRGIFKDQREFFIIIAKDKDNRLLHDIFYQTVPNQNTSWLHKGSIIKCAEDTQDDNLIEQGKLNNFAYSNLENFIYNQHNNNYCLL